MQSISKYSRKKGGCQSDGALAFAQEEDLELAPSCYVAILEGRGAGQYRLVESVEGRKLAVSPPWSVVPDQTSRYTMMRPAVENQIIGNRISDIELTSIMLYGSCLGNLVSGNMVTRSHSCGIQCGSLRPDVYRVEDGKPLSRVLACFYNQIYGNCVSGIGPAGRGEDDMHPSAGIVLRNWYGGADEVRNYGNSVCGNIIKDLTVGINLRVQHGAVVRGNSINVCGISIKEGDHLTAPIIEQNTTGMPGR